MSFAYKVEELLALRDSVSESAISIDRFADEDVIKGQSAALTLSHSHPSLHQSWTNMLKVLHYFIPAAQHSPSSYPHLCCFRG
jgi:hypothetical protein